MLAWLACRRMPDLEEVEPALGNPKRFDGVVDDRDCEGRGQHITIHDACNSKLVLFGAPRAKERCRQCCRFPLVRGRGFLERVEGCPTGRPRRAATPAWRAGGRGGRRWEGEESVEQTKEESSDERLGQSD